MSIDKEEFRGLLEQTGALLNGHFLLSSGLHSDRYFQCARLLQHPEHAERACRELAARVQEPVDVVVGPALGGVIVAHELARALRVRALFTERVEGRMELRRGFEIQAGERVLLVEDVVTTGLSAREASAVVERTGGRVAAYAALVDRSAGAARLDRPFHALLAVEVRTYEAAKCPLCAAGDKPVKPGSRKETP